MDPADQQLDPELQEALQPFLHFCRQADYLVNRLGLVRHNQHLKERAQLRRLEKQLGMDHLTPSPTRKAKTLPGA